MIGKNADGTIVRLGKDRLNEMELTIERLEELDKIVPRLREDIHNKELKQLENGTITEEEMIFWNGTWDNVIEEKEILREKLKTLR